MRPASIAVVTALLFTGCQAQQAEEPAVRAPVAASSPAPVYECSGKLYAVDRLDDAVMVHFPQQARRLRRMEGASGSGYSDGQVTFRSAGQDATLSYSGHDQHCRMVTGVDPWRRAELRGVSFRGVGQEPGWYVEVAPGRNILFVGDYGNVTATAPVPPPITEPDRGITEYYAMSGEQELSVRIQRKACTDSMSGEEFEAVVHVRYGTMEYDGCGRSL